MKIGVIRQGNGAKGGRGGGERERERSAKTIFFEELVASSFSSRRNSHFLANEGAIASSPFMVHLKWGTRGVLFLCRSKNPRTREEGRSSLHPDLAPPPISPASAADFLPPPPPFPPPAIVYFPPSLFPSIPGRNSSASSSLLRSLERPASLLPLSPRRSPCFPPPILRRDLFLQVEVSQSGAPERHRHTAKGGGKEIIHFCVLCGGGGGEEENGANNSVRKRSASLARRRRSVIPSPGEPKNIRPPIHTVTD